MKLTLLIMSIVFTLCLTPFCGGEEAAETGDDAVEEVGSTDEAASDEGEGSGAPASDMSEDDDPMPEEE